MYKINLKISYVDRNDNTTLINRIITVLCLDRLLYLLEVCACTHLANIYSLRKTRTKAQTNRRNFAIFKKNTNTLTEMSSLPLHPMIFYYPQTFF